MVDNNSTDATVQWIKAQKDIAFILNDINLGFPKGCNQGIEIANSENILLLNNDIIVTENWLDNLITCLYSSEDIGAVGPVSNNASYGQKINTNYTNLDEMFNFAKKYNVSNPENWEEIIKLIGFCLLVKKSILEEIGVLDELFSPGNFEDDDLSIRIRNAGYKNIICRDTFIHHYGSVSFNKNDDSFNSILLENEEKFFSKWKFSTRDNMKINGNIISLIQENSLNHFKVLEVGCGCGANLLSIKNKYKNVELYGIDKNGQALKQAERIASIYLGNIEEINLEFREQYFDYIIMDDILPLLKHPKGVLTKIGKLLSNDGKLILSFPNIMNYKYIYNIAIGNKLYMNNAISNIIYKEPSLLFNLQDVYEMLINSKYVELSLLEVLSTPKPGEENNINKLCDLFGKEKRNQYLVYEYIITAQFNNNSKDLDLIIINIEDVYKKEETLNKLSELVKSNLVDIQEIIESVEKVSKEKIQVFNLISNTFFADKLYDYIIPLLEKAFEINSEDRDTIYNIGYILYCIGNNELALSYMEMLHEKNEEEKQLTDDIKHSLIKNDKTKIKFLLRRIENDIEVDDSKSEIIEMFKNNEINVDDIIETTIKDIIQKDKVLNYIAVKCYETGLYDNVIPLLQKSYEINSDNVDTMYNLGDILHELGEDEAALRYLSLIENIDDDIKKLANLIRGEINV